MRVVLKGTPPPLFTLVNTDSTVILYKFEHFSRDVASTYTPYSPHIFITTTLFKKNLISTIQEGFPISTCTASQFRIFSFSRLISKIENETQIMKFQEKFNGFNKTDNLILNF